MLESISLAEIGAVLAFIVTFISSIVYLKKNISTWIQHATNEDFDVLKKKVDCLQEKIISIQEHRLQDRAEEARYRILRFCDELRNHKEILHTKEHFDQILSDIDEYEDFCRNHPSYPNNRALHAIATVKNVYQNCSDKGTFL